MIIKTVLPLYCNSEYTDYRLSWTKYVSYSYYGSTNELVTYDEAAEGCKDMNVTLATFRDFQQLDSTIRKLRTLGKCHQF